MKPDQQLGVPYARDSATSPRHHLGVRDLRETLTPVLLSAVVVGGFATWIGLRVDGATATRYFDDIVTALAALIATVMCIRASHRQVGRLKLFWALLGSASGAWTMAETMWAVYDLVLREPVPVPSWADVGYLSAIPLAVAALLCHPAISERRNKQTRATIDGLMVGCALLYLSWSLVLGPLWHSTDLSTIGGVVAVAYPFGDVVILFLIVQVMRSMTPNSRLALTLVLLGLSAMAFSDSTYTYLVEANRYSTGNPVDTGWVVGYLGLALGAYFADAPTMVRAEQTRDDEPSLLTAMITPYLTVLAALITISVEVELRRPLDSLDWFIALTLVLLVIVRHALFVLDRKRPSGDEIDEPANRWTTVVVAGSDAARP